MDYERMVQQVAAVQVFMLECCLGQGTAKIMDFVLLLEPVS